MRIHKDLEAWELSMQLVTDVYRLTSTFPKTELYGLSSQIRRSAVSVPSNIAEGAARRQNTEFRQFLYVALGSSAELETQLLIAINLGFASLEEANGTLNDLTRVARLLQGLIRSISARAGN